MGCPVNRPRRCRDASERVVHGDAQVLRDKTDEYRIMRGMNLRKAAPKFYPIGWGLLLGSVGQFVVRMSPVDEIFVAAYLSVVLVLSGVGVLRVFLRRSLPPTLFLLALSVGVLATWDFSRACLEERLLSCAATKLEGREASPLLACPEMRIGTSNDPGVRTIHFERPWLFYGVFVSKHSEHRCAAASTRSLDIGEVCLKHR